MKFYMQSNNTYTGAVLHLVLDPQEVVDLQKAETQVLSICVRRFCIGTYCNPNVVADIQEQKRRSPSTVSEFEDELDDRED